ncbi:hypothetical protein Tsubulata_024014 [Turnera subulata]|uniref:Uncharacterized protein n=1 Tax=Turnera subulata TaxID=218843 RepID=A0A9Q0JCR3_9ROSI|nr:hypothetical protein Tsubulata_024014 [Turnera subulata]
MSENNDPEELALPNGDGTNHVTAEDESKGPDQEEEAVDKGEDGGDDDKKGVAMPHVESREEMFEDANDVIPESQLQEPENETGPDVPSFDVLQRLQAMLEKAVLEKEGVEREFKEVSFFEVFFFFCGDFVICVQEEREGFEKEVSILREQLKGLTNEELLPGDDGDVSWRGTVRECSGFVSAALEERARSEIAMNELRRQIEELNAGAQLEQYVEGVADRMLAKLGSVVNPGEMVDHSVMGKIAHVEASGSLLVDHYTWFLYEVDQLGKCLSEGGYNVGSTEEFGPGMIFTAARSELVELKRREMEMVERIGQLEEENRKLVEQVEKEKATAETINAELDKLKAELEQEKNRCANTKEKLSMAVTKGKALVQQRDGLKQSLAEKTSELEKCLAELQEKSSAIEAAELCKGELVKCENLVGSLQETLSQRNAILETVEEIFSQASVPEELQSVDIIGKLKWLLNNAASRQEMLSQKNAILDNFEEILSQISVPEELGSNDILQRLKWLVTSVASLQETLVQRNKILETLEEIFSRINIPAEVQSMDIIEGLRWLVEDQNEKNINLLEFQKLKDALSLVDLPETASSVDLETRVTLLRESLMQAKDEVTMLQDEISRTKEAAQKEIDLLSASLSAELQEKEYVKEEINEMARKYEGVVEKLHQASSERDQMIKKLLVGSGTVTDSREGADQSHSDPIMLIERCFGQTKKESSTFDASAHTEVFERLQSILYVRDQELMLCKTLLEEDMLVRSEANNLSNELKSALLELTALKKEHDSLLKDFERSEEKSALLREKLSMAVKKGKGLVQDRENLKNLLEEKNTEIEKLKLEVQQLESTVIECRNEINRLSTDVERISQLEADLVATKDQSAQLQQDQESLKVLLNAKNSEIDKLELEVQQQESTIVESKDEINSLSTKLQHFSELEADLVATKDQSFELQQEQGKLKLLLDEKNSEIEKLRLDLQKQESVVTEYRAEMNSLSSNLEKMSKLEADLVAMKEKRNELEQFLLDSNNMLQKVFESIDHVVLPVDSDFEEPVAKLNWITTYMKDCEQAKINAEQELGKVKEEMIVLETELAEAKSTMQSMEDALLVAENRISQLAEEKSEIEVARKSVELDLQKAISEANAQTSNFTEVHAARKSLEEALSSAENKISLLMKEREEAQLNRTANDTEIERVREEVDIQSAKLATAYDTIRSLEDALSQAETNISLLTEQNNHFQVGQTNLEDELRKLKHDAESQASKLLDASTTIKSLEDALSKAGNDISVLEDEKKVAEQEISILNSKLDACMSELTGSSGNFESKTVEIMHYLSGLQTFMRNENPFSMFRDCFEKQVERMRNMDAILIDIKGHLTGASYEVLQSHPDMKDDLQVGKPFLSDPGNIAISEIDNDGLDSADVDNITLYVKKTVEAVQMRNKIIADSFEDLSIFMDDSSGNFLRKLRATKDAIEVVLSRMESLKLEMKSMEKRREEQENTIASLEKERSFLLSACADATRDLQFDVQNNLLKLSSVPDLEKLSISLTPQVSQLDADNSDHLQMLDDESTYISIAEKLLLVSRKVQTTIKMFENTSDIAAATIQDLQHKVKEMTAASEKAIEEKGFIQNRILELETHVETLQNSCDELRLQMKNYHSIEEKLQEKEAELSSLHGNLLVREQEADHPLMSPLELKTLFDRISKLELPSSASEVGDVDPNSSVDVKKLFYVVDSVPELHHQIDVLSLGKEELQATLSAQILEIERLKEESNVHAKDAEGYETLKGQMSDLTSGLEKVIDILGGHALVEDQNSTGGLRLLPLLEKRVAALLFESQNSTTQVQDLSTKLLGSQKVIDDLSAKVKLLEDSIQSRTSQPEIVQERSIYEAPLLAPGSEISEIEDSGSIGKNSIAPAPLAAHVRTMRKGSTDHLALSIDPETENLINNEETDEDKGHVFKSLNTSGLIPKQGKLVADRIDGIWVSGGRLLMNRPRARLGLIAYCLLLHLWLLGTIL